MDSHKLRLLRDINIVTHCIRDIEAELAVWTDWLDYTVVDQGELAADLCSAWGTSQETGHRYAVLQPASSAQVFIRLIATGERVGYWPPVTWGWNATEILVTDPDELALKLNASPIERFGGPADLYTAKKSPRAIQTLSPSGAMLYFTRLLPGGSRYGLHGAKTFVDRVFNVVVGGPDLDALRAFYGDTLGLRVSEPIPFSMTLAAQAMNASADKLFPICVAPVRPRHSILELDEYPENTTPRPCGKNELPGGMSMVSFAVDNLDAIPVKLKAEPRSINSFPYNGKRTAVIEGPAGEWLELIETK